MSQRSLTLPVLDTPRVKCQKFFPNIAQIKSEPSLHFEVTPRAINQIMTGQTDDFKFAGDLVAFIKEYSSEFEIGVAGFQRGIRGRRTGSPKWIILNPR
jgi:hypothetical protein